MKSEILEMFLFVKRLKTKFNYVKKGGFIYTLITESLQQLLTNVKIAKMVFRVKKEHNEDVFYDIYDGIIYKNDALFSGKDHTLELIIYHDDLSVIHVVVKPGNIKLICFIIL